MQSVRIYEMPTCKMISSGVGMFGEEKFNLFEEWFSSQKQGLFPKDFLCWTGEGFVWLYMFEEGMKVPIELGVIDFRGGLYAVATDIDQKTDRALMDTEINTFLEENGLERDLSRWELGNVITSPLARETLGYEQMNYYIPVKAKKS